MTHKTQVTYGMQFAPQWTDIPINDVRIQIVSADQMCQQTKLEHPNLPNGTSTVDGKYCCLLANSNFASKRADILLEFLFQPNTCQTIFRRYLKRFWQPWQLLASLLPLIILPIIAIVVIIAVVGVARKSSYASPKVSMETLGVKRGLNRC